MKNRIIILILILFISCNAFSQEETENSYRSEVFKSEQESLNFLSNTYINQVSFESRVLNQQNSVLIQQIGYNNKIYALSATQSSNLELYQNGDNNDINLNVNSISLDAKVLQNGNNNKVLDNIYYSNLDVKLQAIQDGDNLTINRIGVNSLTNKIQLVQKGSFKTITVISN